MRWRYSAKGFFEIYDVDIDIVIDRQNLKLGKQSGGWGFDLPAPGT